MKFNSNFLILAFALFVLIFSACTKTQTEEVVAEPTLTKEALLEMEVTEENFEWWAEAYSEVAPKVEVEYATLEEINAAMQENGLEPFTEKDVEEAQSRCSSVYSCQVWFQFGNFNGDEFLNTTDIINAIQFLCSSSATCSGSLYSCNQPVEARQFGYLSYLNCLGGFCILNSDDMTTMRDFILNKIACN